MAKQIMLVSVHEDETRIAFVEDSVLVGLHVQQTDRERKVGNIYRGRIVKINPAFQAAFVDYGEPRNGFLSISDVNFQLHKPKDREAGRPRIQNLLREGQPVMVQIIKEGMSNKGSALTTFIGLAGRYMVMSPNSDRSGVSRKIEDPDTRRHLKEVMEALAGGEDLGVIIRTAGTDQPVSELKRDLETLRKEWKSIQGKYDKEKRPGLLYQEPSPIVRVLRDYFTDGVQEVWVDDAEGFQEALRYFKSTLPKYQKRLKLYVGDKSLFSSYRIEQQIEALDSARVPLKSGGSIIIAPTEALVSIDVNSGRSNQSQDIEDTALRTNMEAAEEIARQLRLRNLGGLIVIDFIDMMQAKNRKQVEQFVGDSMKGDKARITLGTISQFGLLELSRQRIDMELSRGLRVQCPTCGGTGQIPTVNSSANNVLRKLRELAATGRYAEIHGELPLDAANHLLNDKREALRDLELEFEIHVKLDVDPDLPAGAPVTLHGIGKAEDNGEEEEVAVEDRAPQAESRPQGRSEGRSERRPEGRVEARDEGTEADGARRPRRRRRRRRGGEESAQSHTEGSQQERPAWEDDARFVPPADEHDRFDEELDVVPAAASGIDAEDDAGDDDTEDTGLDSLVGGQQSFNAPHAQVHAEPGAVETRPQRDPVHSRPQRDPAQSRPQDEQDEPMYSGSGAQTGVVFQSQHIVTDPEAVAKMPSGRRVRSSPFKAISAGFEPNSVVFDSANLGGPPPSKPEPIAPAKAQATTPAKAQATTPATAKAATGEVPGGTDAEAEGQTGPRKRRRPARGKGRSDAEQDGAQVAAKAPQAAPQVQQVQQAPHVDLDADEDVDEVNGNVKEPAVVAVAKGARRQPRRPREGAASGNRAGAQAPAPAGAGAAGDAKPAPRRSRSRRGRGRGGQRPGETPNSQAS